MSLTWVRCCSAESSQGARDETADSSSSQSVRQRDAVRLGYLAGGYLDTEVCCTTYHLTYKRVCYLSGNLHNTERKKTRRCSRQIVCFHYYVYLYTLIILHSSNCMFSSCPTKCYHHCCVCHQLQLNADINILCNRKHSNHYYKSYGVS